MSADNTIIVLSTVTEWERQNHVIYRVPKYRVYRVAHIQAWDNFEWYQENQPYNLGYYLWSCFKDSTVYKDRQSACNKSEQLYNEIGYVEYGIQHVDTEYVFPTD